jgi:hypothetical protein
MDGMDGRNHRLNEIQLGLVLISLSAAAAVADKSAAGGQGLAWLGVALTD